MNNNKFEIGCKAYPCDLSFLHKKGEYGTVINLNKFKNYQYDGVRYQEVTVISGPYEKTISLEGIPDENYEFVDIEYNGEVYSIQVQGLKHTKQEVDEWKIVTSLYDYLYPLHETLY